MKGLYESILDDELDVMAKGDKGGERLLHVHDMMKMLVDHLDIVRREDADDPTKVNYICPLYFNFRKGLNDPFGTVRKRLADFKNDMKKYPEFKINIHTSSKKESMTTPGQRREYGVDLMYNLIKRYNIAIEEGKKMFGTIDITIEQYDFNKEVHATKMDLHVMASGFDYKDLYRVILDQMDSKK